MGHQHAATDTHTLFPHARLFCGLSLRNQDLRLVTVRTPSADLVYMRETPKSNYGTLQFDVLLPAAR